MPTSRAERHTEAAARRAQVLKARLAGASFQDIGRQLGISDTRAHQFYTDALRRTVQEPADQLRRLECARLDALQAHLTPLLAQPDQVIPAALALLKVQESRRKLFGLDAPARLAANVAVRELTVDAIDDELARLTAELAALDPPHDPPPPPPDPPGPDLAELLAGALDRALDAAAVGEDRRERAYRAVEAMLEELES
jgi:hypothetical protein